MKIAFPNIDLDINKVVRILVASDVVLYFAIGLFSPIFAIYLTDQIKDGTIAAVGMATALYWIARISTTVPFSRFMDKTDGEKDEFYFMIVGTLITGAIFFMYTFASRVWHVYALQFLFGIVNSMIIPAWRIVFTNHLDRGRTGYYWSIEDIGVGLSIATSAFFGALLAEKFGFNFVLYIVAALSIASAIVLTFLRKYTYTLRELRRLSRERKLLRLPVKSPRTKDHGTTK